MLWRAGSKTNCTSNPENYRANSSNNFDNCNEIWVSEMIKDGGLSFETQLRIEFLPPNNGSKKWLEKSLDSIVRRFTSCVFLIALVHVNQL